MQTRDLPTVVLFEIDTPVIAAINGGAAGYGLDLALGCDIRLMAESAKLAAAFTKRGVVPGVGRHLVPAAPARLGQGRRAHLHGQDRAGRRGAARSASSTPSSPTATS